MEGRRPDAYCGRVTEIVIERGDITRATVDAIVNAANSSLLGGGGVDGAIHAAAGPRLLAACRDLRAQSLPQGLATGAAVATPGFDLAARWVIHTVGPKRWEHADGGAALLASCHTAALHVAMDVGARSVAFPAISCGVYGWDPAQAAPLAVAAVRAFVAEHPDVFERIAFVLFNDDAHSAFVDATKA